jgi:hypothetical protein
MKINWYGDILTDKYYILPRENSCDMPIIKTPCYLNNSDEIDLTFATQEDAKVKECPRCGGDVINASSTPPKMDVSHWFCLCGYRWDTPRGIFYNPPSIQLSLFAPPSAGNAGLLNKV